MSVSNFGDQSLLYLEKNLSGKMLNQFFVNLVFSLTFVILGKVNSFFDQNIILQQNSSNILGILKSSAFSWKIFKSFSNSCHIFGKSIWLQFFANFRSEKQLTLPSGVKGKWISAGTNERLDTYYNSGKCPQIIKSIFLECIQMSQNQSH